MKNEQEYNKFCKVYTSSNASVLEVAKNMNIPLNTALLYLEKYKLTKVDKPKTTPIKTAPLITHLSEEQMETIRKSLVDGIFDPEDIAKEANTTPEEVNNYLYVYNIRPELSEIINYKISKLYEQKLTNFEIAEKLKIQTCKVHKWCKDNKKRPHTLIDRTPDNILHDPESLLFSPNLENLM